MRKFYIVMMVHPWKSLTIHGVPVKGPPDEGCIGFSVVFDTEQNARAAYPDAEIQQMTEGRSDGA